MTELKELSSECEFDNLQVSLIKDMIVCGTRNNSLRERLLWECNLTLSKAISAGYAAEKTRKHTRDSLRERLLWECNLTLSKAISAGHAAEKTRKHAGDSLHERLLWECNVTLSKAISAGHAAEETRKHAGEILKLQPTADIDNIFKKKLKSLAITLATRTQETL